MKHSLIVSVNQVIHEESFHHIYKNTVLNFNVFLKSFYKTEFTMNVVVPIFE